MILYIIKIIISALVIATVSELAKRNSFVASLTAALPLTSLIAMLWIYFETGDVQKIASLSMGIFWLVIPSLLFFVGLAFALRHGIPFPLAFMGASLVTVLFYLAYYKVLQKMGISI